MVSQTVVRNCTKKTLPKEAAECGCHLPWPRNILTQTASSPGSRYFRSLVSCGIHKPEYCYGTTCTKVSWRQCSKRPYAARRSTRKPRPTVCGTVSPRISSKRGPAAGQVSFGARSARRVIPSHGKKPPAAWGEHDKIQRGHTRSVWETDRAERNSSTPIRPRHLTSRPRTRMYCRSKSSLVR